MYFIFMYHEPTVFFKAIVYYIHITTGDLVRVEPMEREKRICGKRLIYQELSIVGVMSYSSKEINSNS